ncbi:MAG: redoxin domain-containing protein [Planctomycetaceae bacterium]|nr:redoxin domain-containing protein [Planctomycetaceae bacterium]
MLAFPCFVWCLLGLSLLLTDNARAEDGTEIKLQWQPRSSAVSWYTPIRLTVVAEKPEHVKKIPDGLANPRYTTISLGPKEATQKFTLLIDEPADKPQRLWADSNGNGDLSDDTELKWDRLIDGRTEYRGNAQFSVNYGPAKRELEFSLYRFNPKQREDAKTSMYCARSWSCVGELELSGKKYRVVLDDALATGDFRNATGVFLCVDVNADGAFDSSRERFDARKPFNVGGTTYELADMAASGESFKLVKSKQTVPEAKPAAVIVLGKPVPAFEAKTLDGKPLKFPDDFKGKTVMLDFWATWCGPCRAELPNLKKVYAEFRAKGFEVVSISLDNVDMREQVHEFAKTNEMSWLHIYEGKGWQASLADLYSVRAIPACFIVNGTTGQLMAQGREARGEALQSSVERALAGTPTAPKVEEPVKPAPKPSQPSPTPPTPTPPTQPAAPPDPLLAIAEATAKAGKLLPYPKFVEQRAAPVPAHVSLPKPSTQVMRGRDVARVAREARVRVGFYYHCKNGDHWHVRLNGAYAIASDTIATAWHVLQPPANFRDGFVVVLDSQDQFIPIKTVLAADERMDTVVLRLATNALKPRPLSSDIAAGDTVFCLSEPFGQRDYFSDGIVNRFRPVGGGKTLTGTDSAGLRVNVSTDWAPGSSGSAVLDDRGNIVGHVATITVLSANSSAASKTDSPEAPPARPATPATLTLHDAVPASSVLTLLEVVNKLSP